MPYFPLHTGMLENTLQLLKKPRQFQGKTPVIKQIGNIKVLQTIQFRGCLKTIINGSEMQRAITTQTMSISLADSVLSS